MSRILQISISFDVAAAKVRPAYPAEIEAYQRGECLYLAPERPDARHKLVGLLADMMARRSK